MLNNYINISDSRMVDKSRNKSNMSIIANELYQLQSYLREKRKTIIGSHISLQEIICTNGVIDTEKTETLNAYLTSRTLCFWKDPLENKAQFCSQFYTLALYAVGGGMIGGESVDDLIQLANCLIHSRLVFVEVVKECLPADRIGELFEFIEVYEEPYFTPYFEDGVLGAVSVFLGVLSDPLAEMEG